MAFCLLDAVAHGGDHGSRYNGGHPRNALPPQDPSGSPTEMLRKRQLLHLGKAQDRTGLTALHRFCLSLNHLIL